MSYGSESSQQTTARGNDQVAGASCINLKTSGRFAMFSIS